jgi:hypothetical protein
MRKLTLWLVLGAAAGVAAVAAAVSAASPGGPQFGAVPTANTKAAGFAPWNRLGAGLQDLVQAQGSTPLENPQGIVTHYGYENDVPSPDDPTLPLMVPAPTTPTEAQKTEPDKNVYLVFKRGAHGADASYDYGSHFLFQGHENGATVSGKKQGYITRINLDADADHRVTLLATKDSTGAPLATIDGDTWDPFAQRLLFTTENQSAPTYAATADYPSTVDDV